MRKRRNFEKTLLIICEGTKTEPNYLGELSKISLSQEIWSKIEILPPPSNEGNTYEINNRKKRKFKEDNRFKDYLKGIYPNESEKIYNQHKAYPIRFVKEAQIKLLEEGFNEAWAVFDKDEHPYPKEAFNLAEEPIEIFGEEKKFVNIAFSSRSFEYWIILHFAKIILSYNTSECKSIKNEDESYECGILGDTDTNNCLGNICLAGYIRQNFYQDYAKSYTKINLDKMMKELLSKNDFAFENASWLRFQMNKLFPSTPIYELNPYTNVDILVKSILGVTKKYVWTELGHEISIAGMGKVKVILNSSNQLEFIVKKINFNPHGTKIYLKNQERKITKLQVIETFDMITESNKFTIQIPQLHEKQDFCIEFGNEILLIEL